MVIAIDYGEKRCGYAFGKNGILKSGVVETGNLLDFLSSLDFETLVFGLPLSMSGRYSCQTFRVLEVAEKVKNELKTRVFLVDERLSTKMAHEILKSTRGSTPVDAVSASLILDGFLKNPTASYSIPDTIPKVILSPLEADSVLVHEVPDPDVLNFISSSRIDVLQSDPYIAYLFKKRVRFVERFERFLEGEYDIILTWKAKEELFELLKEGGELVKLRP